MSDPGKVDEDKRATLRRFAALGAATPFAGSSSADEGDASDARSAITGYLATTPGAHFSKIRDDLQLGTGETQHHLQELRADGAIETRKDGEYRRYFPAGQFSTFEQVALGALRRETRRRMIVELLRRPGQSGTDLASAIGVSRPTISGHAGDLTEAGVIEREDGYRVRYPETVIALLVRYADSFDEEALSFADDVAGLIAYDP